MEPVRILVVGLIGTGKTSNILDIILTKMRHIKRVDIFGACSREPLYRRFADSAERRVPPITIRHNPYPDDDIYEEEERLYLFDTYPLDSIPGAIGLLDRILENKHSMVHIVQNTYYQGPLRVDSEFPYTHHIIHRLVGIPKYWCDRASANARESTAINDMYDRYVKDTTFGYITIRRSDNVILYSSFSFFSDDFMGTTKKIILRETPPSERNQDMCLRAVRFSGMNLEHVPENVLTEEMVYTAYANVIKPVYHTYIPKKLRSDRVLRAMCTSPPLATCDLAIIIDKNNNTECRHCIDISTLDDTDLIRNYKIAVMKLGRYTTWNYSINVDKRDFLKMLTWDDKAIIRAVDPDNHCELHPMNLRPTTATTTPTICT